MDGLNIVGVQFRRAGRIYDFLSGNIDLRVGDDVVVETERGPSLAKVAQLRFERMTEDASKELKTILRLASKRDLEETRKLTPEYATNFARERADRLQLKMSILQSEVQFGGNKVIVYFSASGRVDFRELVKELASGLKARVELKQVGARDEAKLVGGLGICGREFCCSSFLREFVPVSIKMAKNQNLALNPSKVSGGCGRLLCCLTYENDLYTDLRKKLPPRGTRARAIEDGLVGQIIKSDVLNQLVVIMSEDGRQVTAPISKIEILENIVEKPDDDAEAEIWGEDIDLSVLAAFEDETTTRPRPPKNATAGSKRDSDSPSSEAHRSKGRQGRGQPGEGRQGQQGQQAGRGKPGREHGYKDRKQAQDKPLPAERDETKPGSSPDQNDEDGNQDP